MFTTIVVAILSAAQPSVPTTIPAMWTDWCARCHAADGSGKVAEPTITVEPLDFSDCRIASAEPDSDWELAIARGGPAVGLSSEMPAFGDTLSPEQVRGFVDHLRGFCTEPGWPHGNMNFPRPIFTEKAFPENEVVVLPFITHRSSEAPDDDRLDVDLFTVFERRLGRRAMWEVVLPFSSHATGGTSQSGVGDIELAAKYVLHADQVRTRIVSAGLEVTLPTGSRTSGLGKGTPVFEPYLAAGLMLRATYLQLQTKVELPADTARAERAFVDNVYAGRDTSNAPTTWTLGAELSGENGELALTPQMRKGLTRTGALGAAFGVRLPLTERHEQGTSLVGYLLWEYLEPIRARP